MSTSPRASVNPKMLVWGREQAGLSQQEAAGKAGVDLARFQSWEVGREKPTVRQARMLAKAIRRPSAFFYLSSPPDTPPPIPDFRRLPKAETGMTPDLLYELRRARFRRKVALEVFGTLGEAPPAFCLHASFDNPPEEVGAQVRGHLGMDEDFQFSWRDPYEALSAWINAAEEAGMLVFQFGGIDVGLARGFSITDTPLPAVSLNGADAPQGRIFSLLHECCHLALGFGGLCDLHEVGEHAAIETFCNAAAAEALVPAVSFLRQPEVAGNLEEPVWSVQTLRALARRYGVSREVILRRLLTLGKTTKTFYQEMRRLFEAERGGGRGGFIRYEKKVVRNNGPLFTTLLLDAYHQRAMSIMDVSRYLGGIRLNHLEAIQHELHA